MKVVVTGASGGLGSQFIKAAKRDFPNWNVTGFTRDECDLEKPDDAIKAIQSKKPDIILHAAAMTAVDLCENERDLARSVNVDGTMAVTVAARQCGARILFISSDYVFDGKKQEPYREDDPVNPVSVYGATKAEGEKIVGGLEGSLIVRTSWLYGPTGKNFVKTMLELGKKGKELKVVDDQVGSPTSHMYLATAITRVIDKRASGVMNIANSGYCSWFEFAKAIFEEKGMDVDIAPVTTDQFPRPARRPANSRFDCSRYNEIAGETMPHWRNALKEMLKDV